MQKSQPDAGQQQRRSNDEQALPNQVADLQPGTEIPTFYCVPSLHEWVEEV